MSFAQLRIQWQIVYWVVMNKIVRFLKTGSHLDYFVKVRVKRDQNISKNEPFENLLKKCSFQ